MSSTGKGKGKEVAGKDSYGGKRKRDNDDDKTGRNTRNRAVLQFFDDEAGDAGGYDSSDDSIFENGYFDDLFGSDPETKTEPEKAQSVPILPKEEEMSEEELDKMLAERYKSGSGAVTYADDSYNIKRSAHIDFSFPSGKDPIIWKVKCTVGRERHSVFCLMQKYAELRALGTKLQIISAICLDHVKGFIFIEAEKQVDVNEACKGLSNLFLSRTSKVAANEMSQLLSTRNKLNVVSVGTWARVKSGTYKGDLAQVVAVNDGRKRATVKLIPRIDLQVLALKFGGGGASKKTTIPPPRLIGLTELEEFRPLIQFRRDRDTDLIFQVLDGLMLKDGYLYKKVPLDSLNFSGVSPSEDEILKFNSSEKPESNDLEWLSQLYGGRGKKKQPMKSSKASDKGGGKGEGSSSSMSTPSGYEIHDLVCFGRKDFGIILGFEKDNCKIMKDSPEGPVVVTVDPRQLTTALSDTKFTALDQKKKTLSLGDTVKVVDGPSQGRQGIVKQIYRGIIFLNDDNEENDGYFCAKSFMCEKVKLMEDTFQPGEEVASGFTDFPSSPKSHMPRERSRDFGREDKDGMFSIGQTLRIRVGPLKGYLCRVLAIRYSDITVKLNSQTKIFTVKSEHLSEVRKISTISASDDLDSKPSEMIGNLGSSGDWMNGAEASESNGWNAGGATTERSGWPSFPAVEAATSEQSRENNSSSWDNPSKNDAGGWGSGTDTIQNSAWGGWGQKKPEDGEASESTWGQAAASLEDAAGWENKTTTKKKPEDGEASGSTWGQAAAPLKGWENKTTTNQSSAWGDRGGPQKPENNESADTEALGSTWRKDAAPSSDTLKGADSSSGWEIKKSTNSSSDLGGWGQKTQEDSSKAIAAASGTWGKAAEAPGTECAAGWENKKATTQNSWGAWGEKRSANKEMDSGGASVSTLPKTDISVKVQTERWSNVTDVAGGARSWGNESPSCQDQGASWNKPKADVDESWNKGASGGSSWDKTYQDKSFSESKMKSDMDAPGGSNNWNKPGGESSWNNETEQQDSTSVWGKRKDVIQNPSTGWGTKKSTGEDVPNWGGGSSKTEVVDQGGRGQNTSAGGQGGWNKKTADGDQGSCWGGGSSNTEVADQGGWGQNTSAGGQGGWNKKTTDGDQGSRGGGSSNTEAVVHGGWGQNTSAGGQGGWNKKTTDGDHGSWGGGRSNTETVVQGGWGQNTSAGGQGGWNKKTTDGDQGSWGGGSSNSEAVIQGGWSQNTSAGGQGGWNKKTTDGDQSSWGGQVSRDCPPGGGGGGGRGGGGCYSCGESGHMSRECPTKGAGGGGRGGGGGCYSCGESGHMSRECPTKGAGGGGRGGGGCYSCGESGHMSRDCPTRGGGGGGRGGGGGCYSCGESGHMSRDCPTKGGSGGGGGRGRGGGGGGCYSCGESGHMARDCPSGGGGGGRGGRSGGGRGGGSCFKCGETGHFSRECTGGGSG
ncbi:unnamed protein product [Rhodiola kirilowii]